MSNLNFSEYILEHPDSRASAIFHPSITLPVNIPITTPFTFPISGRYVYLCLDKMGWWNPLGGHNDNKYPLKSILPITTSSVRKYIKNWTKSETQDRGKFDFIEALELFKLRDDNNQMFEIFEYIINKKT